MTNKIISYKINSFAVELGTEFIVCIFNWGTSFSLDWVEEVWRQLTDWPTRRVIYTTDS